MLDGRLTVTIDDLPMCYYALGSTESEKRLWEEICESIKKEYEDTKQRDLKIAQDHALSVIATHLSQVDVKTGDIKSLRSDLDVIHEQLSAVRPDDDDIAAHRTKLIGDCETKIESLRKRLLAENDF